LALVVLLKTILELNSGMNEEKYDVVLDVLQKHHNKLWDMSKNKDEWGIMDQIRMRQMQELKEAMEIWKKYRPKDYDE